MNMNSYSLDVVQTLSVKKEQARSLETREAFLQAMSSAIEEKPFELISIADLAALAERSVGSFYTKFRDKEELLDALLDRYEQERARMTFPTLQPERWRHLSLRQAAEALVRLTVEEFRSRRGLFRAFAHRAHQRPFSPTKSEKERMTPLYDRVCEILLEHRTQIGHASPERAVRFAFFLLTSTCTSAILFSNDAHASSLNLSDSELAQELAEVMVSYLRAPKEAP